MVAVAEADEEKKAQEEKMIAHPTWTVPACPCVSWPAASCVPGSEDPWPSSAPPHRGHGSPPVPSCGSCGWQPSPPTGLRR